ncbi:MAG: NADPH-dependent stearoyl-CoA 9-desaturase [Solirubrobacteraceae bacterium]|nr:NADPH-dependent stearoyl-CoA 9-desaturase [Solirubrobacteraceae bacterium]
MTTEVAEEVEIQSPLARLSAEQLEELAREFDAIHDEVYEDLGDRDRRYIVAMIDLHRRLAVLARVLLLGARWRPAWAAGMAANSAAKILENMELGHNILHGQWDWMNDPAIHSTTWDWDTASTSEAWKHSHNYVHHTYTNIRGKDKDLGYEIMRIDPHQKWNPVYLAQPFYNVVLAAFFEWGVASHDLDFEAIRTGEKSKEQLRKELRGMAGKARTQIVKDYIAWPLVSALAAGAAAAGAEHVRGASERRGLRGRLRRARRRGGPDPRLAAGLEAGRETFRAAARANFAANMVRNFWSYAIIFCGHFPDQTYTFSQSEVEDESRGGWYVRQLVGAANIEGGPFFHVASGNLGFQVEHHLFPDMPSTRYAEIAPRVKDICERYGLPYNTGPFLQQLGMVQRTIARLAFPGGKVRPKPGPYHHDDGLPHANGNGAGRRRAEPTGPDGSGPEQRDDGVRVSLPDS